MLHSFTSHKHRHWKIYKQLQEWVDAVLYQKGFFSVAKMFLLLLLFFWFLSQLSSSAVVCPEGSGNGYHLLEGQKQTGQLPKTF